MSIITNFQSWKKVNEKKARVSKSTDPITGKSVKYVIWAEPGILKIKNVGFEPLLTDGKLADQGQQRIKNSVNSDPSVTAEFGAQLTDNFFNDNFLVYTIKKDNDNKEVFTLVKTVRSSVPDFPADANYVSTEELKSGNYPKMSPDIIQKVETKSEEKLETEETTPKKEEEPKKEVSAIDETKLPVDRAKIDQNVKNDVVAQVQKLIINKFKDTKLNSHPTFKKFAGYGEDGKYGPTTRNMIAVIKTGFELADKSGETITKDLITALETRKISESRFISDYSVFEQFNFDAALAYTPVASTSTQKKVEKEKKKVAPTKTQIDYSIWKNLEEAAEKWQEIKDKSEGSAALNSPAWWVTALIGNPGLADLLGNVARKQINKFTAFGISNDGKAAAQSKESKGDILYIGTKIFGITLYRKTSEVYVKDKEHSRVFKGRFTPGEGDALNPFFSGVVELNAQKTESGKYDKINKDLNIKPQIFAKDIVFATDTREVID